MTILDIPVTNHEHIEDETIIVSNNRHDTKEFCNDDCNKEDGVNNNPEQEAILTEQVEDKEATKMITDERNGGDEKVTEVEQEPIKEFTQEEIIEKKSECTNILAQETDPAKHPLLQQLFTECHIVQKILEAYTKNECPMKE